MPITQTQGKRSRSSRNFIKAIASETNLSEQKVRYYTAVMLENYFNLKSHGTRGRKLFGKHKKAHSNKYRIMRVKSLLKKQLQLA